jgi:hypothetical protein
MIPMTINGNTYNSIAAAWREEAVEGLPEITLRWRLKHGWIPEHAFNTPPVDPEVRRTFADVRSAFAEVQA